MTSITEAEQLLNDAIQHRAADMILVTFLQLIVAVEEVISLNAAHICATLFPAEVEQFGDSFKALIERRVLAYVMAPCPDNQTSILRGLIQAKPHQAPAIIAWYRSQWEQPTCPIELVLASIASSLPRIITVIYGQVELFRRFLPITSERETAYSAIIESATVLRAARTHIQRYLAECGIDIQSF